MVLNKLIFNSFYCWEGVVVLKELIFNSFYVGRVWWFWKNWFLTVSTLGGCGGLERTDFWHFLLWEGMVVLKELIFNVFYFRRVLWSWKIFDTFWFLNTFYLRRVFGNWYVGGSWKNWFLMKEIFYFRGGCCGLEWWSWKNWFLTLSTLGRYGGLERTDF